MGRTAVGREGRLRVLVAMSGGVDSAIAAYLLHRDGHRVTGATITRFDPDREGETACTSCDVRAVRDARRTAHVLGISHLVVDGREAFRRHVLDDFVDEYATGRTPNPCVRCNARVKFGLLLQRADQMGYDAVATGHYVRRLESPAPESGWGLYRARDPGKDQSYVLWQLEREQLGRCLFPLGEARKGAIRRLARRLGLPAWNRPESQDICFIPEGKPRDFLARRLPADHPMRRPGRVRLTDGTRIGDHDGLLGTTIGQRKGTRIGFGMRLYVSRIEPETATLWVGPREAAECGGLLAGDGNLLAPASLLEGEGVTARIRYRHRGIDCRVRCLDVRTWEARFHRPEGAVAPGQSVVFYQADRMLGGARIEAGLPKDCLESLAS